MHASWEDRAEYVLAISAISLIYQALPVTLLHLAINALTDVIEHGPEHGSSSVTAVSALSSSCNAFLRLIDAYLERASLAPML